MSGGREQEGSGCAALFVVVLVIAAVVAALISLAALVDPFSWLPPVSEVWGHCQATAERSCDLADRFPGFWGHAAANLAYTLVTAGALLFLVAAVSDLREARHERFGGAEQAEHYADSRHGLIVVASVVAVLAALPIVVAAA